MARSCCSPLRSLSARILAAACFSRALPGGRFCAVLGAAAAAAAACIGAGWTFAALLTGAAEAPRLPAADGRPDAMPVAAAAGGRGTGLRPAAAGCLVLRSPLPWMPAGWAAGHPSGSCRSGSGSSSGTTCWGPNSSPSAPALPSLPPLAVSLAKPLLAVVRHIALPAAAGAAAARCRPTL